MEHLHLNALQLVKGRLPQHKDELLLSESFIKTSGTSWKIGDSITLPIGYITQEDGTRTYSQWGIPDATSKNFHPTGERTFQITGIIDDGRVHYGVADVHINANNTLLMFYGINDDNGFMTTITLATGIVSLIIMIGSISLIYNAFAISLSQRSRYLGMLASIGATRKQKRSSVFFEAFVIGIVAIPIGILAVCLFPFYFPPSFYWSVRGFLPVVHPASPQSMRCGKIRISVSAQGMYKRPAGCAGGSTFPLSLAQKT